MNTNEHQLTLVIIDLEILVLDCLAAASARHLRSPRSLRLRANRARGSIALRPARVAPPSHVRTSRAPAGALAEADAALPDWSASGRRADTGPTIDPSPHRTRAAARSESARSRHFGRVTGDSAGTWSTCACK